MGADGTDYTFIIPKVLLGFLSHSQMRMCMQ